MNNTGQIAGYTQGELALVEDRVKSLGITTQVSREIIARFAQNQLDVADAARVARVAQDAAVVAGVNSSVAAEKIAVAIQRLDTRMLRNVGILVNLRQEYQAYGLETGRVETSLTAAEKQQITLNAVMRSGVRLQGNYVKSLEDVYKQWTSLDRLQTEAAETLGRLFLPVLQVVVDTLEWFYEGIRDLSTGLLTFISTSASIAATLATVGPAVFAMAVPLKRLLEFIRASGGAWAALQAVVTANPYTIGIVIATTAIAGLVALYSSLTARAELAREKAIKSAKAEVAQASRLQELAVEVEHLSEIEDKSPEKQSILNGKMREAISLIPEQDQKLFSLNMTSKDFLDTLQKISRQDLLVPLKDHLDKVKKELEEVSAKAKKARAEATAIAEGTARAGGNPGFGVYREADALDAQVKLLEARKLSLEDQINATALRRLEEQNDRAETALQLAERLRGRLEEYRVEQATDPNAAAISRLGKELRTLTTDIQSIDQIEDLRAKRLEQLRIDTQRQLDIAKDDKARDELEASQEQRRLEIEIDVGLQIRRREDTLRTFRDAFGIAEATLSRNNQSLQNLRRELDSLERGESPQTTKALLAISEEQRQAAAAARYYGDRVAELSKELTTAKSSLATITKNTDRRNAKARIEVLEKQLRLTIQSQMQAIEREELAEKKHFRELNKQATDEARETLDKINQVRKSKLEEATDTQDFIRRREIKLEGEEYPGETQLLDLFGEFRGAISQAGNADQIQQLVSLFRDEAEALGAPQDAIDQAMQMLAMVAEWRRDELLQREAELRLLVAQLRAQLGISDAIKSLSSALPGARPEASIDQPATSRNRPTTTTPLPAVNRPIMPLGSRGLSSPPITSRSTELPPVPRLAPAPMLTPFDGGVPLGSLAASVDGVSPMLKDMAAGWKKGIVEVSRGCASAQDRATMLAVDVATFRRSMQVSQTSKRNAFAARGLLG